MIGAYSPPLTVAKYPRTLVNSPLVSQSHTIKQGDMHVDFAGLGLMGPPMAINLLRAGTDLTAYNRSAEPRAALAALGQSAADSGEALDKAAILLADQTAPSP